MRTNVPQTGFLQRLNNEGRFLTRPHPRLPIGGQVDPLPQGEEKVFAHAFENIPVSLGQHPLLDFVSKARSLYHATDDDSPSP